MLLFHKILLALFFVALVFTIIKIINIDLDPNLYPDVLISSRENKIILFWTPFFSDSKWQSSQNTDHVNCSLGSCIFTNEHYMLPSVNHYDAIVFHSARKFPDGIPNIRSPWQSYIFTSMESPYHTDHNLRKEAKFYNVTVSYRLDSDVVWSYSHVLDRESGSIVAPHKDPKWMAINSSWTENNARLNQLYIKKTGASAWFVSNCKTPSARERLVEKLQTLSSVDVYGECGTHQCPRFKPECNQLLEDYFFYLSFENSLCVDYVTEKLYNYLKMMVVPVVYGGANYTQFAPPHSYINVEDFANVEELAEYLNGLMRNPKEYLKYFWWHRYYKISDRELMFPRCELCDYLYQQASRNETKIYKDIEEFWQKDKCRKAADIYF